MMMNKRAREDHKKLIDIEMCIDNNIYMNT